MDKDCCIKSLASCGDIIAEGYDKHQLDKLKKKLF